MTENEAIEVLNNRYVDLKNQFAQALVCVQNEENAIEMAISALKEIQQYRAIGTVEECREAREKQRAKKPNGRYKTRYMWDSAYCPVCGCGITARWNFCQSCGQAIDWSDTSWHIK